MRSRPPQFRLILTILGVVASFVLTDIARADCHSPPQYFEMFLQLEPTSPFKDKLADQILRLNKIAEDLDLDLSRLFWVACNNNEGANYDLGIDRITLPEFDGDPSHELESTLIHEYTHAIHFRFLKKNSPKILKMAKEMGQLSLESRQVKRENLVKKATIATADELIEINLAITALDIKIAELKKQLNKNLRIAAHSEFIADLAAVLMLNDKDAIKKSLMLKGKSETEAQKRSFSGAYNEDELKLWKAEVTNRIADKGYMHPYHILAPLRAWFGNEFMARPYTAEEKSDIIQKILAVSTDELESQMRLEEIDPLEFNTRFYNRIKNVLQK